MSLLRKMFASPERLAVFVIRPFQSFVQKEVSSGIILMVAAAVAMLWANSPFSHSYHEFWHTEITIRIADEGITKSLAHWIDEGLMVLFFFTVGLEIKREMLIGELASLKKAMLPVAAALGGMIFPAGIYFLMTRGTGASIGWGIPMATDIAFALGVAALVGRGLPSSLRIFLSAFAIADDLGAVLIIAIFYQKGIVVHYLLAGIGVLGALLLANLMRLRHAAVYGVLGFLLWLSCLAAGIHTTVAGVLVAIFIPARGATDTDRFLEKAYNIFGEFQCPPEGCGHDILTNARHLNAIQSLEYACHEVETPLQRMLSALHPWVALGVIPLFALANGGVTLTDMDIRAALSDHITLGIALGLIIGKPVGIALLTYLPVRLGIASLPLGMNWKHVLGAGLLGGMGFTMSLFIAGLSFPPSVSHDYAKVGIMIGSVFSGVVGLWYLRRVAAARLRAGNAEAGG